MTLLRTIPQLPETAQVEGVYRLISFEEFEDALGRVFARVGLEDHSHTLDVYTWKEPLAVIRTLPLGQRIEARLAVHHWRGKLMPHLLKAAKALTETSGILRTLPSGSLPKPGLSTQLERLISGCELPALQDFLERVFSQDSVAHAFLTLPASRSHHHSWPGGLAEHSLEVARIIQAASFLDVVEERALGITAGLLHDIGKIRTFAPGARRSRLGRVVAHETLTLEILAPALASLDRLWPDGATALRYLLASKTRPEGTRPLLPIALLLDHADRYSAATSARRIASAERQPWQNFATLQAPGPRSRFWYPRMPETRSITGVEPPEADHMKPWPPD